MHHLAVYVKEGLPFARDLSIGNSADSYLCFCSTMAFPPLGSSHHVVVSVSLDFSSSSQWDAPFHRIVSDYYRAD